MKNSSGGIMAVLFILFSSLIGTAYYLDFPKEWMIALFTAAISVLGWIYSNAKNAQREVDARLFSEKAALYKKIFNLYSTQIKKMKVEYDSDLHSGNDESGSDQIDLMEKLLDIKSELLIWGSEETIGAWIAMEDTGNAGEINQKLMIRSWGSLYSHMRSDLGHFDSRLKADEMISFFLTPEDRADFLKD